MEEFQNDQDFQRKLKQISPAMRKRVLETVSSGRKVRALGFWKGQGTASTLPHPKTFQDASWNEDEKKSVIHYLQRGAIVTAYLGLSTCRFECGETRMGACDLTDGTYCWPEGLTHYLEKHDVRLPEEFVNHVRENVESLMPVKGNLQIEILAHFAADFEWWRSQPGFTSS